ncbi:MAG TPA: hypothetical protein VJB15_10250 [Rhodothermia bacterium]|nr:hypothetical protein [Rhodothermia bacterium]
MPRLPWLVAVTCLALEGCAHSQPSAIRRNYEAQVITEAEIIEANVASAYDVIRKLRANFLSYRGRTNFRGSSASEPRVYVDEQPYGAVSSLRTIRAGQVAEIRLYRAWEATTRFGTGNMDGVIAVTTRK